MEAQGEKGFSSKQQIGLRQGCGEEIVEILFRGLLLADVNITSKGIGKCQSVVDLCTVGAAGERICSTGLFVFGGRREMSGGASFIAVNMGRDMREETVP